MWEAWNLMKLEKVGMKYKQDVQTLTPAPYEYDISIRSTRYLSLFYKLS